MIDPKPYPTGDDPADWEDESDEESDDDFEYEDEDEE